MKGSVREDLAVESVQVHMSNDSLDLSPPAIFNSFIMFSYWLVSHLELAGNADRCHLLQVHA